MRLGVLCLLDLCILKAQHIVSIQYLFTMRMNIEVYFLSLHAETLSETTPDSGSM
ncbi:branched chain aminotransferase 1, cytosolic, isoform CRA_h [Rattus norvegicus]|uniref:Branched chain aminotransferase 1, cytosolic, isoform CRA_h n=1 Tax=Rattus norvegicus TaxID=10116 RepID=A6IMY5_RAT|nr:branched chain aminotransferase 1, cytosolic, isoform CRA_h [Rattus norvegicus]